MEAKKFWILAFLGAGIFAGVCWPAAKKGKPNPLVGLNGVYVWVKPLNPEAEKYGLTEELLQTDAELRLRRNGIRVLSKEEWLDSPWNTQLSIIVNVVIAEKPPIAAAAYEVYLLEDAILLRNLPIPAPDTAPVNAVLWSMRNVLLCDVQDLEKVRQLLKDIVDRFSNDYFAANPKAKDDQKQ